MNSKIRNPVHDSTEDSYLPSLPPSKNSNLRKTDLLRQTKGTLNASQASLKAYFVCANTQAPIIKNSIVIEERKKKKIRL